MDFTITGKILPIFSYKQDFECYVTRLEDNYKQELQALKLDIQNIGGRVGEADCYCKDLSSWVQDCGGYPILT